MKTIPFFIPIVFFLLLLVACGRKDSSETDQTPSVSVKTTNIRQGDIENNISLNGKTIYLKKNAIVSPIAGYILKINVKFGDRVQKNEVLFEIQTKENKALENININGNNGIVKVVATSGGVIDELNISASGGYVIEGGALCSIVENKDLMIQVNVPFENNSILKTGTICKISLPDNTSFNGSIAKVLPVINEASQTQNVLIKPYTGRQLPENLNLSVQFTNIKHISSFLVAKEAVMSNETLDEFWVMKVSGDRMAIKVPVVKGIENDSMVEISSPDLKLQDLIIREGAYGLPDSALIKIEK